MKTYQYPRGNGLVHRENNELRLQRKARYRGRHRKELALKQDIYRNRHNQETNVIKHGKIHKLYGGIQGRTNSHLEPIKEFVKKGIADAREAVVLQPCAADVKGAKRFNGQQCVIARALTREHHPEAVAVGRSFAYAVFKGLAVRFKVPAASRQLIEEFDSQGRVKKAPIELAPVPPSLRFTKRKDHKPEYDERRDRSKTKRKSPMKRYGVRAIGGGVTA